MNTAQKTLDGLISVKADYYYKSYLKAMGAVWNPYERAWLLPYTKESWDSLQSSIAGIVADDYIKDELDEPYSDTDKPVKAAPQPPIKKGITLYKHQFAAYAEAYHKGKFAYLFEMGCGKSLASIALIGQLYIEKRISKVLVVCPLAVVPVWGVELAQYADFAYSVTELGGSSKDKIKALSAPKTAGLQVYVINYESTWRIEKELLKLNADMIICDESQRIKNPTASQSKAMHNLGDKAKYKLILTGTPITATPLDFWSQYRFLDSRIFGLSYYSFKTQHAVTVQENMGGKRFSRVVGYRNLKQLCEKAHSISYRVTKKAALDLPAEVEEVYYCEFEPKARRLYNELRRDSYIEIGKDTITTPHKITQLLRLSQFCGGYVSTDYDVEAQSRDIEQVSGAKLSLFTDIASDILDNPSKKVVVFARFRPEIHALSGILTKIVGKDGYRTYNGDTKEADRAQYVQDFQTDLSVRVFLANQQCAGLGITLTAADTVIFYSNSYNFADYEQAKARVHRIGQKNKCSYIHLVIKDSIDEAVLQNLKHKGDTASLISNLLERSKA